MTFQQMNYKFSDGESRQEQTAVDRIRSFIAENRLTQKEFASRLRVSAGAVAQWLAGKRKVPGPVLAYLDLHRSHKFLQLLYELKTN